MQMAFDPQDGSFISYRYDGDELTAYIGGDVLMRSYSLRGRPTPEFVLAYMADLHRKVTGTEGGW